MVPVQVDMIINLWFDWTNIRQLTATITFENNPGKNMSRISLYELSTYITSVSFVRHETFEFRFSFSKFVKLRFATPYCM